MQKMNLLKDTRGYWGETFMKTVSIVIPAYNEEKYISILLEKILQVPIALKSEEKLSISDCLISSGSTSRVESYPRKSSSTLALLASRPTVSNAFPNSTARGKPT